MNKIVSNVNDTFSFVGINKRWLSPLELEIEYGISRATQSKKRMAKSNSNLPFSKVGGLIKYDRYLIDRWLESHQVRGVENV